MSSYSEYLSRKMQRTQAFVDTRPHRDAGHQTEIVKRLAASGVQDSKTPKSAGVLVLNGPSTQVRSFYAKAHTVQDPSTYNDYTAGQAVAQSAIPRNAKAPQIQEVCYSATTMPDFNDKLRIYPQEALKQAAKNNLNNCCRLCGEPAQYTTACPCTLTATQQVALKDAKRRFTTPS
jgi:hypothetical protein